MVSRVKTRSFLQPMLWLVVATLPLAGCGKSTENEEDPTDSSGEAGDGAGGSLVDGSGGAADTGTSGRDTGGAAPIARAGSGGEDEAGAGGDGGTNDSGAGGQTEGGSGGVTPGMVCTGDVAIANLADLAAFAARECETLKGTLTITSPSLTNLEALAPNPVRIITGGLVIDQNPALTDITALAGLERVAGSLVIVGNPLLASIAGLEDLRRVGSNTTENTLVVGDNPLLESLSPLEGIDQLLTSVTVTGNAALKSLAGVDRLRAASNITIAANQALEEIGGLTTLEECGVLTLASNPGLESVALPALRGAGSLGITGNTSLETVALPSLEEVPDTLTVAGNPELTTLGTLDSLTSVGQLIISGNAKLPQCFVDALDARLHACGQPCVGNDAAAICD